MWVWLSGTYEFSGIWLTGQPRSPATGFFCSHIRFTHLSLNALFSRQILFQLNYTIDKLIPRNTECDIITVTSWPNIERSRFGLCYGTSWPSWSTDWLMKPWSLSYRETHVRHGMSCYPYPSSCRKLHSISLVLWLLSPLFFTKSLTSEVKYMSHDMRFPTSKIVLFLFFSFLENLVSNL